MRPWAFGALFFWLVPVLSLAAGGLGVPLWPALVLGALCAGALATPTSRTIAIRLASDRMPRLLAAALLLASAAAIVRTASISVFMADVTRPAFSVAPTDEFRRVHSCMSAYAEAARFVDEGGHNIYHSALYRPAGGRRWIGPLAVDAYHYPPPFLLLPQAVRAVAPEFFDFRRLWFVFQALVLAGAALGLAVWIGGRPGQVALLGGLILLALPHTAATFQQGNFQITAVPLAASAWVLLMSGRGALGGGVLAYAALAKVFPGILLIPLVTGQRWRAAGWVAGMGGAILLATLAVQGAQPFRDFVSTSLPDITSGAAFPQTEVPTHAHVNWSAYGQTVRLRALGATWLTKERGLLAADIYGLLIVALAAWAGWRARFDLARREHRVLLLQFALGIISLASFRSPFVGAVYGAVSTLWLMSLLAARAPESSRAMAWIAGVLALAWAIWIIPSPGSPGGSVWVPITGGLLFGCMAVNVWAVVTATAATQVRVAAAEPAGENVAPVR